MKTTTHVFAKFENRGYPKDTKKTQGALGDVLREYLTWNLEVTMGSKLVLVVGRTETVWESGDSKVPDASTFEEILLTGGRDLNAQLED